VSDLSLPHYLYQEEVYGLKPKVLVILGKDWSDVSTAEQLLLSKILESVKLSIAAVQIITIESFDLHDIVAYNPAQLISFGSKFKRAASLYEIITIEGASIILADPLDHLNDATKKSLWGALKQMFLI